MNTDGSACTPIFLDDDEGLLAELPLMVTRHTLSSLGISLETLSQVDPESDQKTKTDSGTC